MQPPGGLPTCSSWRSVYAFLTPGPYLALSKRPSAAQKQVLARIATSYDCQAPAVHVSVIRGDPSVTVMAQHSAFTRVLHSFARQHLAHAWHRRCASNQEAHTGTWQRGPGPCLSGYGRSGLASLTVHLACPLHCARHASKHITTQPPDPPNPTNHRPSAAWTSHHRHYHHHPHVRFLPPLPSGRLRPLAPGRSPPPPSPQPHASRGSA